MRGYRFSFINCDGHVEAAFALFVASDEAAREVAADLFSKCEYSTLEVWNGSKMVFRFSGESTRD